MHRRGVFFGWGGGEEAKEGNLMNTLCLLVFLSLLFLLRVVLGYTLSADWGTA